MAEGLKGGDAMPCFRPLAVGCEDGPSNLELFSLIQMPWATLLLRNKPDTFLRQNL